MKRNEFYSVVDRNGYELPKHSSGRYRTEEEANRLVIALNKNGEFPPYKKKLI